MEGRKGSLTLSHNIQSLSLHSQTHIMLQLLDKRLRKPKAALISCALFSSKLYHVCRRLSPEGPNHPISCSLSVRAQDQPNINVGWSNQWPALWEDEDKRFIYLTNYTGIIMESLNTGDLKGRVAGCGESAGYGDTFLFGLNLFLNILLMRFCQKYHKTPTVFLCTELLVAEFKHAYITISKQWLTFTFPQKSDWIIEHLAAAFK